MAIDKTTTETKNKIKANSVIALPNRPQIPAEQLKQAFVKPIVDTSNSMIQELDRIVEETNAELEQVQVDITYAINEHNTNTEATHLDIRQEITDLDNDLQGQIDVIDDTLQNHESRIGELELFAESLETNITEEIEDALENKADLVDGKVPREQMDDYFDDIIEGFYINHQFYSEGEENEDYLITPELGKLYVDVDTNVLYRWIGSQYEKVTDTFELTKAKIEEKLTGDITSHNHATEISNHNSSGTSHSDIRTAINNLQSAMTTLQNIIGTVGEDDENEVIDKLQEVFKVLEDFEEDSNLVSILANKVDIDDLPIVIGYLSSGVFYKDSGLTQAITGSTSKIYIDIKESNKKIYWFNGTVYEEISKPLSLGTGSNQAFYGDLGQTAYEHSQSIHAPSNAQKNVQSDWNQTDNTKDDYIKNKPTIPTKTSDLTNDSGFLTSLPTHNHDDRYYTESEIDTKLGGKADSSHTHTKSEITDFPTTMTPTAHQHTKSEITDFPTIPTIPDITVNNGSAESGKYISAIAVDSTNKHKLNITKENLPTLKPTIELEVASLTTLTEAEKLAIRNTLNTLIVDDKIDGTKFDDIVLVTTSDLIRLHYSSIDYYVANPQITVIFETQSTKYILHVPLIEYTYSTLTSTTTTIPTISTSITTDATDDTKTASPKAVKTYVDNVLGDIETLLGGI